MTTMQGKDSSSLASMIDMSATCEIAEVAPSFHPFARLPLELRLRVWRQQFPAPQIMKNVSANYWGSWNGKPFSSHHRRIKQPVTLYVNHESRVETLRTYRNLSDSLDTCKRPLYFSPAHDAIHLGTIMSLTKVGNCVRFLAGNEAQTIEKLSHIQVLILDGLYMDEDPQAARHQNHDAVTSRKYWSWNEDEAELEGKILAKFHGLKKLWLVLGRGNREYELMEGAMVEPCERLFRRYFEIEQQKWPDCSIPEVEVLLPNYSVVWDEEDRLSTSTCSPFAEVPANRVTVIHG